MRPVEMHVRLFFAFLCEHCRPGEMIDADDMAELYQNFCDRGGLVPRKWNPIAKELKFLMGRGPDGSIKPYNNVLQADGTYREMRVWFVPARARRRSRTDRQSTPELTARAA